MAWLAVAVAFVGAVALIVIQLRGKETSPDSTTFGLFVVAAVLGFAALAPGLTIKGLRRVTRFKVGSVELGLAEIKRAERVRPPQEDDGVRPESRPRSRGYEACADRLRDRLERVRQMVGLKARKDDYAGIAEALRLAGLLNRDEETFVVDLQSYDPLSDDWSSATEEKFLDDTWAFATRFRALVWDRHVRNGLTKHGWSIFEYEQKRGHRPDFLAYRDQHWALIAARVGSLNKDRPDELDAAAKRLWRFDSGPTISSRSIVIPDRNTVKLTDDLDAAIRAGVQLLTLDEFLSKSPLSR